ncbi:unnamed protein product [Rhizoctonia solani]|uniref:Uncharacterized protein n=1 Tax=Rhizoctonia solani TaxID=456999 RepID=A0A8H3D5B2_9AGAM|nr:unnamed protein product [Rhizoctonia solani]
MEQASNGSFDDQSRPYVLVIWLHDDDGPRNAKNSSGPEYIVRSLGFETSSARGDSDVGDAPKIPVLPAPVPMSVDPEPEPKIKIIDEPTPVPAPAPSEPVLASTSSAVETEVITVARSNTKSRKRKTNSSGTSTPQETKKTRTEVEEFDYTNAPSILDLDQGVEEGASAGGRKRERKKAASVYGNFPAPPKAQSEQRAGNRTHTFKK